MPERPRARAIDHPTDERPDVPEHADGRVMLGGLPFAICDACEQVIVLDDDRLAGRHVVPCGRPCRLSPDVGNLPTCGGGCTRCWKAWTGCDSDPDRPCGRRGCHRCGRHKAAEFLGRAVCNREPPTTRFAWSWADVTCGLCLALAPAGERGAALAVRSVRRSLAALSVPPESADLRHADGEAVLRVSGVRGFTLRAAGPRRPALLTVAAGLRAVAARGAP